MKANSKFFHTVAPGNVDVEETQFIRHADGGVTITFYSGNKRLSVVMSKTEARDTWNKFSQVVPQPW